MSNNRITPFVKRMRTQGGTIYVFSSAAEDIGLNINEKNNDVRISHFALLNIPKIQYPSNPDENRFNLLGIDGALEYANAGDIKDGRILVAESFQNYALNLESNLLNQAGYDATLQRTVSERVFWKWLKETGAIRWANPSNGYWMESEDSDGSLGYNTVVKYVGLVSAGNVRSDSFGTYNEIYIMVPTSHGQMEAYFEQSEDSNYRHGMEIGGLGENILGRETWTQPHPDGLSYQAYYDFVDSSTQVNTAPNVYDLYYDASPGWWYTAQGREPLQENTYMTDSSSYLTTGIYDITLKAVGTDTIEFKRSSVDCMGLVFDLNKLKTIYGDSNLTFDSMATGDNAVNDRFEFNAVLVYYSVYNSVQDTVLATNLLGILFLDAPSGNSTIIGTDGILIPSLEKIQSTLGGFGTSYALRLNIKTDNMIDDTGAIIVDDATSDIFEAENWNLAFAELGKAVNILTRNNSVLNYISDQYTTVQSNQTQMLNSLIALQEQVNDIAVDIQGTENAVAMFSSGEDSLVEASIYMKDGNVGIFNIAPTFPFQVDASAKMKDIYIEKALRDSSGNILISYGSPLQIGSTTKSREIDLYTGNLTPAISIDTFNNVTIDNLKILQNPFLREGSLSTSSFFWNGNKLEVNVGDITEFIKNPSLNTSFFTWNGGLLETVGSLPDPFIIDGSITAGGNFIFNNTAGTKYLKILPIGGAGSSLYILGQDSQYLTGGDLYLKSGAGVTTNSGDLYLESGSAIGISGDIYLRTANAERGGNINIKAGNTSSISGIENGGSLSIFAGDANAGRGGDVSIRSGSGGTTGRIFIGTENVGGIYAGLPSSTGSNVVYYNSTTKALSYGTLGMSSYDIIQDNSIKNVNIPEPSANMTAGQFYGRTIDLVAGVSISSLSCVIPNSSGRAVLADADSSSLTPAIAINAGGTTFSSVGSTYRFLTEGVIRTPFTWIPGKPVYLSSTGSLTQTAPSTAGQCVQVMGIALTNQSIYFKPSMDVIVLKA